MKISHISIKNFRSIRELEFIPGSLTALIGPNGSGKTNILRALDLIIGEGWTTKAKVARELFHDPDKPINIKIRFETPISHQTSYGPENIFSIELELKLRPELSAKTTCNGGRSLFFQDVFKKNCHFIFIPSDRQLVDELRVSQWTMLGKLMRTIYENYVASYDGNEELLKEEFKIEMQAAKNFLERDFSDQPGHITFAKFISTFQRHCNRNSSGMANDFEPILDIYNLNWFYKTLQIHVKEQSHELPFDSEEVGAGMQNLLVLSIFQTYAELMGGKVILGIEEPEIYLYPQAQRTLFKNFIEISPTSQIFYTTHNPNFIDASRADDIQILRKSEERGTYILEKQPYFSSINAERERHRIYTQFNLDRNELFFSKKVLFVEGDSDKILFTTLCKEKWGIDLDSNGYAIISCGGKGGVNYFVGVANLIGYTDFFAVWDRDNEDDYSPTIDFLSTSLEQAKGLEIVPNLEQFLGLPGTDKVKNAYQWATNIALESIPESFVQVQHFFRPQN